MIYFFSVFQGTDQLFSQFNIGFKKHFRVIVAVHGSQVNDYITFTDKIFKLR